MDEWVDGWAGGGVDGWIYAVGGWVDRWMDAVGRWMNGSMDGCMAMWVGG